MQQEMMEVLVVQTKLYYMQSSSRITTTNNWLLQAGYPSCCPANSIKTPNQLDYTYDVCEEMYGVYFDFRNLHNTKLLQLDTEM